MKTNCKVVMGVLVAMAFAMVAYAQPPLDQSVLVSKSVASTLTTGHQPTWQVLPLSNGGHPGQNKIERYHGMSSQPWSSISSSHASISSTENCYDHEPQLRLASLNF